MDFLIRENSPILLDIKKSGMVILTKILVISFQVRVGYKNRQHLVKDGQKYLDARKIKAFYNVIDGFSLEDGINALTKSTGFGKMSPNIVLVGYKPDWNRCRKEEVESYFSIL